MGGAKESPSLLSLQAHVEELKAQPAKAAGGRSGGRPHGPPLAAPMPEVHHLATGCPAEGRAVQAVIATAYGSRAPTSRPSDRRSAAAELPLSSIRPHEPKTQRDTES